MMMMMTRCQILRLKCTKFDFAGAPPHTPLGILQRSLRPLAVFKGPTSKGREGKGSGAEQEGKGREGRGGEGGRKGEERAREKCEA